MTTVRWLGTAYPHPDELPASRWQQSMQTQDEYRAMVKERQHRDQIAPEVGQMAPDFVARVLVEPGEPEQPPFQLAATRGRPVALIFGSYT